MVSLCLPSDALSQHLPSYLGFSYLRRGVSLHGCSSKAQPLLPTLDEGDLLTAAPPDLGRGVAPLGPPAPAQLPLPVGGAAPLSRRPWPQVWGSSFRPLPLALGVRSLLSAATPWPRTLALAYIFSLNWFLKSALWRYNLFKTNLLILSV